MHLKKGNNYIWLCPAAAVLGFLTVFMLLMMLGPSIGIHCARHIVFGMPLILASSILLAELRSGIALDVWWTAVHEKGQPQYTAAIRTQIIRTIIMLIAYVALLTVFK
jgi:hypothetical protein